METAWWGKFGVITGDDGNTYRVNDNTLVDGRPYKEVCDTTPVVREGVTVAFTVRKKPGRTRSTSTSTQSAPCSGYFLPLPFAFRALALAALAASRASSSRER